MTPTRPSYTGRFAPSPSGPLHLGSLVAALGSWLDARAVGGRWLLRIEDLDSPRNAPGAERRIVACLQAHGLEWDQAPVRQRDRLPLYERALESLRARTLCYPCACTRREVDEAGGLYPGTCRNGLPPGRAARAWRLRCPPGEFGFVDRLRGTLREDVAGVAGDFVLRRADGIHAYQLAVVVDDAEQGISDVVRGVDLLTSTGRQRVLQQLLGLPELRYLHLPLAVLPDGRKLSKQNHAPPLDERAAGANLIDALQLLGQPLPVPPGAGHAPPVRELLDWAIAHWCVATLPIGTAP
ncbi:MAG: tRNA glutamyl-Q(34) synthetase GluQRS [Pseudomonadota bacterium]|nr:tRNA glutamyl-Q(34) synthetase GluQRS [Pseudomonadota bacterium]